VFSSLRVNGNSVSIPWTKRAHPCGLLLVILAAENSASGKILRAAAGCCILVGAAQDIYEHKHPFFTPNNHWQFSITVER